MLPTGKPPVSGTGLSIIVHALNKMTGVENQQSQLYAKQIEHVPYQEI
jgi:hypothetical protein